MTKCMRFQKASAAVLQWRIITILRQLKKIALGQSSSNAKLLLHLKLHINRTYKRYMCHTKQFSWKQKFHLLKRDLEGNVGFR